MPWPTPQDYNEAIQNPRAGFADPELQAGSPELTPLGLPRPITGNFASVYRIRSGGRDWAVRCFFREYADMGERYAAISRHLSAARLPYTVGFEYLERGIRVRGSWYPILKMEWIEGELLNTFVASNLGSPGRIQTLAERWLQMLTALDAASIAHGDLQHGNVLVVGDTLKLVDYDGMFVPPLAGRISHEIGHPNYQHPARTGRHFSPAVDRFSGWVVYLSLLAVARQRDLWDQLTGGDECLLFRKRDFDGPAQSPVFSLLTGMPDPRVRSLTEDLRGALGRDPLDVPPIARPQRAGSSRRGRRTSHVDPAASSRAPAWVEQLRPPVPPRAFGTERARARLALIVPSAAAAACAAVWAVMSTGVFLAVSAGAIGVDLLVVLLLFALDPAVAGRRAVAQRARRADRALACLERHLERCERDRVAANDRFSARSMDAAESREGLKRRLDADRAAIREAAQQRRSAIQARLRDLDKIERESLDRLLRSTQDRHVRKRLRRTHLLLTRIPGLPWYARWRLWAQGIRNAEHVTSRAPRLASLPSPQVTAILLWRVEAEAAAKRSMPASAPKHRSRPIAETAGRRRRQLERALRRVDIWEGELLSLLERKHERRMANVEEQVRAASERLQHDLAHIEERVAEVRDRQPVEAHRLAQAERELEPYRAIDFGRFLRFLLLP